MPASPPPYRPNGVRTASQTNASGMASELGSMRVTEQLDAMRALGTDPIQKLVTPRLIATAFILPLLTIIGLQVSRFLGAAVVVEAVFGIPGIGTLVVGAAHNQDYPVVEGVVLVMALIVIVVNFAVDVSYRLFDPRIR